LYKNYFVLNIKEVPSIYIEEDEEIRKTAWFDYRIMTSAECTDLFAETYQKTWSKYQAKLFDVKESLRIQPQNNDVLSLWLARQAADRIGCKYDFYMNTVFQIFDQRGWDKLPTERQLHSEELSIDISRMWEERCNDVLQLAESPYFTAEAYSYYPNQYQYYAYLIEQLQRRAQGRMIMEDLVKRGILPQSAPTWPSLKLIR
jgi:hypothetical protein